MNYYIYNAKYSPYNARLTVLVLQLTSISCETFGAQSITLLLFVEAQALSPSEECLYLAETTIYLGNQITCGCQKFISLLRTFCLSS